MNMVEHFRTSKSPFKATYGNFIGGKWVPAQSGRTFDNTSPITGEVICKIPSELCGNLGDGVI